ncbi:MAG TPA: hypothetical protein VKQ32_22980 [Polyangia bacterium]|nr:hypothetical protein [Polyangia bacterium]
MKSPAGSIVVGAGLALLAGCTTRPLQPDAGGSGSLGIDAGTIGDVGGAAIDGPLFSGRRSFIVTSTLVPTDGGTTDFPLSHTFTMVIDGDKLTEFSGQGPYPIAAQLQPTAGGFRIVGVFAFNLVPGCTGRDVNYSDVSFRFDPSGRLLGSASGKVSHAFHGETGVAVTASLTGVDDTVPPTITFVPGGDLTDPFLSFRVFASEPLQPDVLPILRAASGDTVVLTPSFDPAGFVALFYKPDVLLRYGETYNLDISGVRDFNGNAAVGSTPDSLTYTTRPLPPLVAQDGFESVTDATLGGAEVLTGAGDPIISGARSLYVAPISAVGVPALTIQFALRLAVAPGDTVVRLTYRGVNPNALTTPEFVVASVNGPIASASAVGPNGNGTFATIDGTQVLLGPIGTASIPLPQNVSGEIVIACWMDATTLCNTPQPTEISGIIIDDLRLE